MQNTKPMKISQTVDMFIDSIQWSDNRAVLVHRREHGGREYVRFRTWNRHKTKGVWYPSKRSFVVPVGNAEPLADALRLGADGVEGSKPDWFLAWEREEQERSESATEHTGISSPARTGTLSTGSMTSTTFR